MVQDLRSHAQGLTWDDLNDTGLLHVGWQVARPHVLLHDSHVGQFLQPRKGVGG